MNTVFSQNLKSLRKRGGYTQLELSELLGVGRSCIANWESGTRIPDIDTLTKIALLFGVSAEQLLLPSHNYTVRPENIGIDISKLSDYGIEKLKEYYKTLLFDKKCVKK